VAEAKLSAIASVARMEGRDQASRRRVAASEASRNRRARRRPRRLRRDGVAGTS